MDSLTQLIESEYESGNKTEANRDDLASAYRISAAYMLTAHGIRDTVRFLRNHKRKSREEVAEYVSRGIEKTATEWTKLVAPSVHINVEGDGNTISMEIATGEDSGARAIETVDEDPHRFTPVDMLKLEERLKAHDYWKQLIEAENAFLKRKSQGEIEAVVVAFVGCLWRKNLRSPAPNSEPGAVPFDACTNFFRRDQTFLKKAPSNLQIGAAIRILEAVQFLKRCRAGIDRLTAQRKGIKSQCATYRLLNEDKWE